MAEENPQGDPQVQDPKPQEPHGPQTEPQGPDWKKEAKKWEERSKENFEKAKKYDELMEAERTELEKAQARAEKAEAELAAAKAAADRAALVSKVAEKAGVPASLLHGDTEEELEEEAKALVAFAESKAPGYPSDKGGPATPPPLTKDKINEIKNPRERLAARAANAALYQ